jgi:hypothetical protein
MTLRAISISQLVLNEIAWSPGDPGTGAPSFLEIGTVGVPPAVSISTPHRPYCAFSRFSAHGSRRRFRGGLEAAARFAANG